MRIILIAALIVATSGCRNDFPAFPSDKIKNQLAIILDKNGEPFCVKYPILNWEPYQVGRGKVVSMKECQGMTGLSPKDTKILFNWIEDALAKARQIQNEREEL